LILSGVDALLNISARTPAKWIPPKKLRIRRSKI
jgi:hypothetical protein